MASKTTRRYSDEDRATALAALAANGGNVQRTAGQLNVPERTLSYWSKTTGAHVAKLCGEKKGTLADQLESIAWKLVETMPSKLAKANLTQVATALGIVIDKARLLREEAADIDKLPDDPQVLKAQFRMLGIDLDKIKARPNGVTATATPALSMTPSPECGGTVPILAVGMPQLSRSATGSGSVGGM